jgi:hypothetical protein
MGLIFYGVIYVCEVHKVGDETVLLSCYLVIFINLNFKSDL